MRAVLSIFVLVTALSASATASAQQKIDLGKREYENSCAVCHGVDAKGGGLYAAHLKANPPDLTVLAKANGGVFPMQRMYDVIDGRAQVQAHGPREMPIWGKEYTIRAEEYYVDDRADRIPMPRANPAGVPYYDEAHVRNRILLLIDYLYRVQQK